MKVLTRTTALFISIVFSALFCATQQASIAPTQKPSVAVANKVQLVIEGKVINVHDGDTVTVLDQDNKKFHIRLQGIDAPELKQPFGPESQQNLSRMLLGKKVTIFWTKVDKYRRTVGTVKLYEHDVNIEQVKAGLAWHFKKYEDEQTPEERQSYAAAEQSARAAKLGLWNDQTPVTPGDWRRNVQAEVWGPPPPKGTIIGNKNSQKYHRPDCAGYRSMLERNRVFFKTVAEAESAGYKRAGNCPAEVQGGSSKSSVGLHIVNPAPPSTTSVSHSDSSDLYLMADPMLFPKVTANKRSKVYSLPGCPDFGHVGQESLIVFNSGEEAEKVGYKLAANCPVKKSAKAPANLSVTP